MSFRIYHTQPKIYFHPTISIEPMTRESLKTTTPLKENQPFSPQPRRRRSCRRRKAEKRRQQPPPPPPPSPPPPPLAGWGSVRSWATGPTSSSCWTWWAAASTSVRSSSSSARPTLWSGSLRRREWTLVRLPSLELLKDGDPPPQENLFWTATTTNWRFCSQTWDL